MSAHRHRVASSRTVGYTGPVGRSQNQRAHGGCCIVDYCACGCYRRTNRNGGATERGVWIAPETEEQAARLREMAAGGHS